MQVDNNLVVPGQLVCGVFFPPDGCITNAAVALATPIDAEKIEQQKTISRDLCAHGVDFAAVRKHLHTVQGATGTLLKFQAGNSTAAGATTTVTIQLKKNGSNILSAAITLDSTNTAFTGLESAAGFSSAALVAGDVLEVDATISGTNEPQGVFVTLVLNEAPIT